MKGGEYRLVLIRHGHSEWNLTDRFTGWADISLTEQGLVEAREAGRRLAAEGFVFDEAHVSVLRRSRQTVDSLLLAAGYASIPVYSTWRLNERHYGQMQGMNKAEIAATWDEQRSRRWWRGYLEPPPQVDEEDPRHPRFDPHYADLEPALLPCSESLRDCQQRLLPYWQDVLAPRIQAGRRLIVVSHGNALRSLVMHLAELDSQVVEKLEIPPGIPFVCCFNADLELIGREWLE
jgi:2,3-bisphosphoglycerate-dependent phosphoglycerate mutase